MRSMGRCLMTHGLLRGFAGAALLSSSVACDREIFVGSLPEEEPPLGGGQGGMVAASGGGSAEDVPAFSSDFETGDFSEWGLEGALVTSDGGEITVQSVTTHEGRHAAQVSTSETGAHVVLTVSGPWTEVLIRFWIRLDTLYETPNWPILHIDAEQEDGLEQLWDLGLDSSNGENYGLFLWEMPAVTGLAEGTQVATSTSGIAVGTWTEIEVHLRAAADNTGYIRVLVDDQEVMNLSDRPAGTGDPLHLGFGSFAYYLEPRPADFLLDDVEILVP